VSERRSRRAVEERLAQALERRVGVPAARLARDATFESLGLDSEEAVEIAGELEAWLGRPVPATVLYDNPTIAAVAEELGGGGGDAEGPRRRRSRPAGATDPVALVGIGCRFPGGDGPDEFWELLRDGRDAVREPPTEREALRDGGRPSRRGAFLDGVDRFDAAFFGISPREAAEMDPQQRLLLEVAWEALEDGGIPASALAGEPVGVFVGVSGADYFDLLMSAAGGPGRYAATGGATSLVPNRLSYALDLRGPSVAVDTACSSSLVAVHLACQALRTGDCDLALAGGVNLVLRPEPSEALERLGMLSDGGRCRPFDDDADGFVRGEGAGVVVLKRLADARADGDPVYALVRGSAVGSDGRSNGVLAPNGKAQAALLRGAYERAGVDPAAVSYVEAHGVGAPLGDAVEANALGAVLAPGRTLDAPCAFGSVKGNIGHLESAAGIASVVKVALALRERRLPPSIGTERLHRAIAADSLPLELQREPAEWKADEPVAGVSAFGFGGTGAHAVLQGVAG
jgi:acyl transferase domain-containing protein/acyl carrier protein